MTPKPLTPEERQQVERAIARTSNQWDGGHPELKLLLSAEAYWREEVKTIGMASSHCPCCGQFVNSLNPRIHPEKPHAENCPWLAANLNLSTGTLPVKPSSESTPSATPNSATDSMNTRPEERAGRGFLEGNASDV
jgi:hypothetical protein